MKLDDMIDLANMCSKCGAVQNVVTERNWAKIHDWLCELAELREFVKKAGAIDLTGNIFNKAMIRSEMQRMAQKIQALELLERSRILNSLENGDET